MNLKQMLERAAKRYADKTAVVMDERRLSYAELDEASNRVANALVGMGIGQGDRVALLLTNSPEFVAVYFGVIKIGAVAVLLDHKYKLTELVSLCDDSKPRVLVTESPRLEQLAPVLDEFKSVERVIGLGAKRKGKIISYKEITGKSPSTTIDIAPAPEDIAHIAYTSGPSFHPWGVAMSHGALVEAARIYLRCSGEWGPVRGNGEEVTICYWVPRADRQSGDGMPVFLHPEGQMACEIATLGGEYGTVL